MACLLHDLTDSRLALLEGPQRLIFGGKLFHAETDPACSEIYLAHGVLSFRVIHRVDLTQDLQVSQAICLFLHIVAGEPGITHVRPVGSSVRIAVAERLKPSKRGACLSKALCH